VLKPLITLICSILGGFVVHFGDVYFPEQSEPPQLSEDNAVFTLSFKKRKPTIFGNNFQILTDFFQKKITAKTIKLLTTRNLSKAHETRESL